ncbi:MAG: hypothetical protein RMJ28_07780, partial [Nitrososphaerota archaeon]|nr:hypothetical protein [Nitrososphaerota archaeon]
KRQFLGALCDDEAWIRIEPNSTQVCLKVAKLVELEHDLDAYLNQLRDVFNSLGIECSTPKTDRKYLTSKGVKISKRIWITGKQNVIAFAEKIKLNHPEKSSRLRILLAGGVNGEGGCPEHARR